MIAQHVRGVHQRAFTECAAISKVLIDRQNSLERAGFEAQVKVRGEAPLSFVHPEGRDGPRFRVEPCPQGWTVGAHTRSTAQVFDGDPLCVSTSALLRPIVQDTIFPTAAIVAGPGELNYFAQLSPLYSHFGIPMPMLVPRARFRVIEPRAKALMQQLALGPADFEVDRDEVLKRSMPPAAGISPEALEQQLLAAIEPALASVSGLDDAVKRTRGTIARAANRFAGRYRHSLLTRDQVVTQRVDRIQRSLFPHGEPQERVLGLPGFAARTGIADFTRMVLNAIDPFSSAIVDLSLTGEP